MNRTHLVAVSALMLAVAGCGSSTPHAAPTKTVTAAAPAPSPTYDQATVTACTEAAAAQAGQLGNPHTTKALLSAKLSDQATLRDIESKVDNAVGLDTAMGQAKTLGAIIQVATWCSRHHVAS